MSQLEMELGPKSVPTDSLRPNPHNPRRLFDKLPLQTLEDSIRRVGVLVPLTVFRAKGSDKFTILDGQRRWICASNIGLATVPINEVPEPGTAQNIVTMFQIHKLREDWELMPTALKLGVLMEELQERSDNALAELTGLNTAVVTRCKKLLTFEEQYQDMMLYADPKDRIKADFFIELYPVLNDRTVVGADWYNRSAMIESFLRKYRDGLSGFKSITDFRKIKQYLTIARAAGKEAEILSRLGRLVEDDGMEIADLEIDAAKIHREATNLVRTLEKIEENIDAIDTDEFLGEEELWVKLEGLVRKISEKLASADRRKVS
ncbi:ParB/RepB/Spo0J family partition protein [Oceaniglobus trochenteri]|uniref:ParB/RepB/Spo0J family partition protein n=1 Tax=Oceaniglobus trochenteri TaxID=2763260 RepID=UPI001CFFA092